GVSGPPPNAGRMRVRRSASASTRPARSPEAMPRWVVSGAARLRGAVGASPRQAANPKASTLPRSAGRRGMQYLQWMRREASRRQPGSLVHDDAAAAQCRGRVAVLRCASLVVIDHRARGLVRDLDPEPVDAAAAVDLAVDRGEQEAVHGRAAVDRALALELGPRPGDDEPLVAHALECELRSLELELGIAGRRVGALQV